MLNESDSFKVGDLVRPFIHNLKSVDRKHMLPSGRYTISLIRQREERGRTSLFLRFRGIEGEYHAHQFTKEPSKPTRQPA